MDRLRFFQVLGLGLGGSALSAKGGTLAGALVGGVPEVAPRFRPISAGGIEVSRDGGRSWELHARFGPDFEVRRIREGRDGTVAQLRFRGTHDFQLRLDEGGLHWKA